MKIPQHPGIVCRDFVQREGTDETTFVLKVHMRHLLLGIWASYDSFLSAFYSRGSRPYTVTFRRWEWGGVEWGVG